MRITKIELHNFRGFPRSQPPYVFDLGEKGENLLVYGENGSGKSSLFRSFVEFFNPLPTALPFADHRNLYTDPAHTDGHVAFHFSDGKVFTWDLNNERSTNDPVIDNAVRRSGFLEYRSLLRTNFVQGKLEERLFDLAVEVLLKNIPVTLGGRPERTLGWYWQQVVDNKPKTRRARDMQQAAQASDDFSIAVQAVLPDIQQTVTEILSLFGDPALKVTLEFPSLRLIENTQKLPNLNRLDFVNEEIVDEETNNTIYAGRVLKLQVEYRGQAIENHVDFLNEARLSAIALALYFASVLLSNPGYVGSQEPLRLLVLDDVLFGLDMANRLPVLEILKTKFAQWQIVLMTYDRAWYEIAKARLSDWKLYEMFAVRVDDYERPLVLKSADDLALAREFLQNGQIKAAAVHARTKFELVVKDACERISVKVKYQSEPNTLPASEFWTSLKAHQVRPKPANIQVVRCLPKQLVDRLEHSISWVLNPLSHSQILNRHRREIEEAIDAIEELECAIKTIVSGHIFDEFKHRHRLVQLLKSCFSIEVHRKDEYEFILYASEPFSSKHKLPHIYARSGQNLAKFWLSPVYLARNAGFTQSDLAKIETTVRNNAGRFISVWRENHNP